MRGLFVKRWVFSFTLMVVSTRSWSLPILAPEKDLVFALLMLDLKRWDVRTKPIWLWTCPLGAFQVAILDNLWGWRVLARVSRWLFANSRSLLFLTCHLIFAEDWGQNLNEWAWKADIRLETEFIAVGEACRAIFWPTPCLKKRTFESLIDSQKSGSRISASAV